MGIQGIEFAADTVVDEDAIRNAGYGFVVGHLGADPAQHLTATQANEYIDAGLTIVSVYDAPAQPTDGTPVGYDPSLFEDPAAVLRGVVYRAGVTDGRSAYSLATTVGQAAGSAIYFEVGADVNAGISYVLDYFRGIAEGFAQASMGQPGYKVGVLGSGFVLDAVTAADLADYKWLAAPTQWQGSAGYTTYDIVTYDTADTDAFPGAVVNHEKSSDSAPDDDFGQWGISTTTPNLVIYDLSVRPDPLTAGGTAKISFTVGNVGTGIAPGSTATLYLSTDAAISTDDTVLGSFDLPSLAASVAASDSMAWDIPADFAAGTYYVGVAAAPVPGESSVTDNGYAVGFTVFSSTAASTNLVINQLTLGAPEVAAGGIQTVILEVGNAGLGASGPSSAKLYLSTDATISTADSFIGAFSLPILAPGAAALRNLATTIPDGTELGTYHIGVIVDPVAGETNANDNIYAAAFEVGAATGITPNLVINDLALGKTVVAAGGTLAIEFVVGNAGAAVAAATTATLYLSSDETITSADTALGSFSLGALDPGGAAGAQWLATIPGGTAAGSYFIGVVADPVAGEPNGNDNAYAVPLTVNRTAGSVSIADVTLSEGNSGTTLASFIVTRSGGITAFSVDFATTDGGATVADGDYAAATGTVIFGEGVVAQTITVAINGDLADETALAETFFVNLSGATNGAVIGDGVGQGLIFDDDARNNAPVIGGRDVRLHIGQRVSGGSLIAKVTDADGDAITEYGFRDSTEGGGFLQLAGVAQPAGGWTTVAASALGTLLYVGGAGEGSEAIEVRAFDGQDWSETSQLAATTIADIADDYGSTPASAGSIGVDGSITGRIETASDADWLAVKLLAGRIYQFDLEGSATAEGTLADPIVELRDASGLSLELAADDNGGVGDNARLTYMAASNDTYYLVAQGVGASTGSYKLAATTVPTAQLAITALDARKPEGQGGTTEFTFLVTRTGDLTTACSARYAVAGAGARPAFATDFADGVFPSGQLEFLAGEATKTISIGIAGDVTVEDTETFVVTLTSLSAEVVVETASAEGLIKDDDTITDLAVINSATGQPVAVAPTFYSGPVARLEKEIILITADNVNATVSGDNWFIRTGSGSDALAAHGGRNVLDGGTGSNFLNGASGEDTFFLDARGAAETIWSTVVGFGSGDSVTVWGASQQDATITWTDDLGAPGYQGLTMQASGPGLPDALVTLAGYSRADLDSGRLQVTFGAADAASPYLHISATV